MIKVRVNYIEMRVKILKEYICMISSLHLHSNNKHIYRMEELGFFYALNYAKVKT